MAYEYFMRRAFLVMAMDAPIHAARSQRPMETLLNLEAEGNPDPKGYARKLRLIRTELPKAFENLRIRRHEWRLTADHLAALDALEAAMLATDSAAALLALLEQANGLLKSALEAE